MFGYHTTLKSLTIGIPIFAACELELLFWLLYGPKHMDITPTQAYWIYTVTGPHLFIVNSL